MISSQHLPQFDREDFDSRLKTLYDFLPCPCSFAVPFFLSVPTSTSHLLSDAASVEQAALSSLYVSFMFCFAWFASKALLFARATATVDAIVPLGSSSD